MCTNLCISIDGFLEDLRVMSVQELYNQVFQLMTRFDAERQLNQLRCNKRKSWLQGYYPNTRIDNPYLIRSNVAANSYTKITWHFVKINLISAS